MLSATSPGGAQGGAHGSSLRVVDTNDPLSVVRRALDAEEQLIRVSDSETHETYDVTLSRTMPYASPLVMPVHLDEKKERLQPTLLTPPPTRRRRLRWMRSSEDNRITAETPPSEPSQRPWASYVSPWSYSRTGSPGVVPSSGTSGHVASPATSGPSSVVEPSTPHSPVMSGPSSAAAASNDGSMATQPMPTHNSGTENTFALPSSGTQAVIPTGPDQMSQVPAPSQLAPMPVSPHPDTRFASPHTPLPPLSNIQSMLGQSLSSQDVTATSSARGDNVPARSTTASPQVEPPSISTTVPSSVHALDHTQSLDHPGLHTTPVQPQSQTLSSSMSQTRLETQSRSPSQTATQTHSRRLPPSEFADRIPSGATRASSMQARQKNRVSAVSNASAAERTFDEEMAANANALRLSWRAKGQHAPDVSHSNVSVRLKGNLIGEDHANYVLMYHMLTGIRIAVSRNESRPRMPLTQADFVTKYKFTFDIIGNELRPSSNYDFKFKDYAPAVFRELRVHFGLDAGDYLLSLAAKYILTELGSPGKSGSFFYFSHDYRFIIKTIRPTEHKLFIKFLPAYYEHVRANPHTLLSQFYGLHRVKLPGRKKIHFVIMNNLFPSDRDVHEVYDLKGSTISREQTSTKPTAVLKDMNWIKRGRFLELGPERRALFERQLRSDVALLQRLQLMDYSLLIGLHDLSYHARPNVSPIDKSAPMLRRPSILVSPVDGPCHEKSYSPSSRGDRDGAGAHLHFSRNHPPETTLQDMQGKRAEQQHSLFYQDEGGFRATDEQDRPLGVVYYFGIIDLFTRFDARKRSEHVWKAVWHNRHAISPVPPVEYGERFIQFLLQK